MSLVSLHAVVLLLLLSVAISAGAAVGKWDLLLSDIGISAMHMQLLFSDRVVIFDSTSFGRSKISLPGGKCRRDQNDCTAHSVEYDIVNNSVRPLTVVTNVWCSSGAASPGGSLIQTGGYSDGYTSVRVFNTCTDNSCDWQEIKNALKKQRWYATDQILPDGRQIIIGGRRQFSYEFFPKGDHTEGSFTLPFLIETFEKEIENNLYPFVFLNVDGNLFIFANNRAILFDYTTGKVVKRYPEIPGGHPRSYPSTGSAVLLPLTGNNGTGTEVLVCGGAPKGSYTKAKGGDFVAALDSCGRIGVNDENPRWIMEKMPINRTMGDMVLLPNGDVLIINGAGEGSAGWELGRSPVLSPVLYKPNNPVTSRFEIQAAGTTPRLYHSTAVLFRDGRVMVGGNNPHSHYSFTSVLFPTDFSLESFSPAYLSPEFSYLRSTIVAPQSHVKIGWNQTLAVRFTLPPQRFDNSAVAVTLYAPPFNTHSFSMNQRLLILAPLNVKAIGKSLYQIRVWTPVSGNFAPPGYYILFVVYRHIPSEGIWVQIN